MSFARRITARSKLIAASVLAGAALLLVSLFAILAIHQLGREFSEFSNVEYAAQAHLGALQMNLGAMRNHEKDALLNFDDAEQGKQHQARWQQSLGALRSEFAALQASLADADRQQVTQALADYERLTGDVIRRGINGQIVTATEADQALAPAKQRLAAAHAVLERLDTGIRAATEVRRERVARAADDRRRWIACLAGAALLLFVPAMAVTVLSITRPMEHAIRVAHRIAGGDVATPVLWSGRDEAAALMQALSTMQSNLNELVSQLRGTSESIALASAEISAGSADLSSRTERTVTDLQHAGHAVGELGGLVEQAASSARSASGLSDTAVRAARQGGAVVLEVAERMQEISRTSHRIADITNLIDGIAFQTNLLALNAAVEAARAGDQGRGFAVVAAEVRALSQRTTQAAGEIKQLIKTSVEQVDTGAVRAKAASADVQGLVTAVEQAQQMMAGLSRTATTQAQDVAQVTRHIDQLDRMTQQNAALVVQSAAAAQSLSQQAQGLSRLMDRFSHPQSR